MKTATTQNVQSMFRAVREGDEVSFKLQGSKVTCHGTVVAREVARGRTGGTTLVVETTLERQYRLCWRDFGGSLRTFHVLSTVVLETPAAEPVAEVVTEVAAEIVPAETV